MWESMSPRLFIMKAPLKHVTIPAPIPTVRSRGIFATGDRFGNNLRVRVSEPDFKVIEQEAQRLHMPVAEFVRWCATRVAKELEKHHQTP